MIFYGLKGNDRCLMMFKPFIHSFEIIIEIPDETENIFSPDKKWNKITVIFV